MTECTGYRGIYQWYYDTTKSVLQNFNRKDLKILKTDCHNETGIYQESIPIIPMASEYGFVEAIEYDQSVINKIDIGQGNWNIQQGDIRNLPYKDNEFDCIIELSTIDHIPMSEVQDTLSEYHRVLKKDGKMLMVVWLTIGDYEDKGTWESSHQYFFNKMSFEKELCKKYEILKSWHLFDLAPNNTEKLYAYILVPQSI